MFMGLQLERCCNYFKCLKYIKINCFIMCDNYAEALHCITQANKKTNRKQ